MSPLIRDFVVRYYRPIHSDEIELLQTIRSTQKVLWKPSVSFVNPLVRTRTQLQCCKQPRDRNKDDTCEQDKRSEVEELNFVFQTWKAGHKQRQNAAGETSNDSGLGIQLIC